MSHFAQISSNGIVLHVITCDNNTPGQGLDWITANLSGTWIQTSYNTYGGVHNGNGTPLRKNYAGIGFNYDSVRDAFIPPKPYPSWILGTNTCLWGAPVAHPTDGKPYAWDESTLSWKAPI